MKVGILTSGGDAPGMNACVLNLIDFLREQQDEVYLVTGGYQGLLEDKISKLNLKDDSLNDYYNQAGSFIFSGRAPEFKDKVELAVNNIKKRHLQAIIVIGGNGTYLGAKLLSSYGVKTIFIPASIDNDVDFSEFCLGYSSAAQEVVDDFFKMQRTTKTHNSVCFMEIMGRHCKDLATLAFKSSNADVLITHSDKKVDNSVWTKKIKDAFIKKGYAMVLVSEYVLDEESKQYLINQTKKKTKAPVRYFVNGHLQRGADVVYFDLKLAKEFASLAVTCLKKKNFNSSVVIKEHELAIKPYEE